MEVVVNNLNLIYTLLIVMFAAILSLFLYFRAGRHELVEIEILFDSAIIGIVGALVGGRLLDFFLRSDFYNWSLSKLIFFNVYRGFDWYGALFGFLIVLALFLRKSKHVSYWFLLDLASAPLIFGAMIIALGLFLITGNITLSYFSIGFLAIFWILKRLASLKRHEGYFVSLSLILVSILNIGLFTHRGDGLKIFQDLEYRLFLSIIMIVFGFFIFYLTAQRGIRKDSKELLSISLLGVFKFRRILTSKSEANQIARYIILLPLYLAKFGWNLVKLLGREIGTSFFELMQVFGFKK